MHSRRRSCSRVLAPASGPDRADCGVHIVILGAGEVGSYLAERLSNEEQALLYMKHTRGLRCREIAQETGRPIGTVTAALSRIYVRLRAAMIREASL